MRTIIIIVCLSVLAISCNKKNCKIEKEVAEIPFNLEIERLEEKLFGLKSIEEIITFLNDYNDFSDAFLQRAQYPNDTVLARRIFQLINDPYIDTLYHETKAVFGDASKLEDEFEMAFRHLNHYYPDAPVPKIYTAVTGLGNDLFVSDSLIVIGLDFFLGEGARYRPVDMPDYILKRYSREYIVPSVMLLLSQKYNETDYSNKTMLADMIFYGKAYYFTKRMMPCAPDSLLIGYTGQELKDVNDNEEIIWSNFIQNELLYETSHAMKNKFLGERPRIQEIGPKCPGRIGAWLGWEIVERYMNENNEVSLKELMRRTDAQQIFTRSKYRPD